MPSIRNSKRIDKRIRLIGRKTIAQGEQSQYVIVIMNARGKYLIECNFLEGEYFNKEWENTALEL
ncbi:MAG: hypothetical protein KKB82_03715 [Candidatus Omnitrophica bacterium]|nr:hypothetical protein [Candidatus Omnitrophota bacterium]MBU1925014.1 hypothetical protein [Candidatus Omnitrophota bacterium]